MCVINHPLSAEAPIDAPTARVMTEDTTAAAPAKAQKKRPPRPRRRGTPLSKLILEAVANNKSRKGASVQTIKKYLSSKGVDTGKMNSRINAALVRLVKSGVLRQVSGVGASGSFLLAKPTLKDKPARRTTTKPRKSLTAKKPRAPKTAKRKSSTKKTTKKTAAKKTAAKKTVAKKTVAKKTVAKKSSAKKVTPKKTSTRKPAASRSTKPKQTSGAKKATPTKRSRAKK